MRLSTVLAAAVSFALLSPSLAEAKKWDGAVGQPWDGVLVAGVCLPERGQGFTIPSTWKKRGLNWGTRELVGAIMRAASLVDIKKPGAELHVADLSMREGGRSGFHRSHQNGLDVDLIFYAVDEAGRPAPAPASMRRFDKQLRSGKLRFDLDRNWLLVRALITDKTIRVQHLFVAKHVEKALLAHARRKREPVWLIERADALMSNSGGAHDDHFHLRIACPSGDRGCGAELVAKKKSGKSSKKKVVARADKASKKHKVTPQKARRGKPRKK